MALAWQIDPSGDDPGEAAVVLRAALPRLRHVRFLGGGPEAAAQTGRGVGSLMAQLTLARYIGPLVLTPTTSRYRQAWSARLGRSPGWGCGSRTADPSLITLPPKAEHLQGGRT